MEQQNLEGKLKIHQWNNYELKDWIPFYGLYNFALRTALHNKLPKHYLIYSPGLVFYNLTIGAGILHSIIDYTLK